MSSPNRDLPPLNALVTFEAAARTGSFTRAAAERHVTQAAVSRQIQRLEAALGVRLFRRGHRRLELTAPGRRLQDAVSTGLAEIAGGVRAMRHAASEAPVSVAATIAFAGYWLMPRIHAFRQRHPEVDVRLIAVDRDLEPGDDLDIAVRYGSAGSGPGERRTLLGEAAVVPVASPGYLRARPRLADGRPEDLLGESLLHLDEEHWNQLAGLVVDWPLWFERQGLALSGPLHGIRLNNYPMLLEAVLAAQGVGLGWRPVVDGLLAEGRLVALGNGELVTGRGYYAVTSTRRPLADRARLLHDWLAGAESAE